MKIKLPIEVFVRIRDDCLNLLLIDIRSKLCHKDTNHPLFPIWYGIFTRCYDPKCNGYKNYGRRGIGVCERWFSFKLFVEDVGEKPRKDFTLGRINVDGNYEPSNCRWASWKEQAQNKRVIEKIKSRERLSCLISHKHI